MHGELFAAEYRARALDAPLAAACASVPISSASRLAASYFEEEDERNQ